MDNTQVEKSCKCNTNIIMVSCIYAQAQNISLYHLPKTMQVRVGRFMFVVFCCFVGVLYFRCLIIRCV